MSVEAEVTALWSSGGDNYHYEITYTISGTVTILAIDEFSSGGITADLAIRDIVRNKCAALESDVQRIGSDQRIIINEKISSTAFEPKAVS